MSATGVSVFDETVQLTNIWLKDLMLDLEWEDRHRAYLGLRLTLQALRDHLSVEEAAHLGAQLPMLVRGFYYEGWHPAHKPVKDRSLDGFIGRIYDGFRQNPTDEPVDAGRVAEAVFALLSERISKGEVKHVRRQLPKAIRVLWPEY